MKISIIVFLSLLLFSSCGQNLPENYGIYVDTNKGRIALPGQKILFKGNLMVSITGLKEPSGIECKSVKSFIVYKENINSESIKLSRLEFKRWGSVQNIIGRSNVEVNLWAPANLIDINIAPIEGRKDMYNITPKAELSDGFYTLYFGGLGNSVFTLEASMGNIAYDFVVGDADNYPSYELMKKRNEEKVKAEAETLLKMMNNYFNNRDYAKMKEIYRPDGRLLSASEWQKFTKGLGIWLNAAGKTLDSKIVNSNISDNEGMFQIQTVYERKGQQNERLVVRNMGGKYFITSLE